MWHECMGSPTGWNGLSLEMHRVRSYDYASQEGCREELPRVCKLRVKRTVTR